MVLRADEVRAQLSVDRICQQARLSRRQFYAEFLTADHFHHTLTTYTRRRLLIACVRTWEALPEPRAMTPVHTAIRLLAEQLGVSCSIDKLIVQHIDEIAWTQDPLLLRARHRWLTTTLSVLTGHPVRISYASLPAFHGCITCDDAVYGAAAMLLRTALKPEATITLHDAANTLALWAQALAP